MLDRRSHRLRRLGCGLLSAVMVTGLVGCDGGDDGNDDKPENVYLCIGDSITGDENYPGVAPYPTHLQNRVQGRVVNKGNGGETSLSGAGRIRGLIDSENPSHVLILYGANDILRGWNTEFSIENLRIIVQSAKNANVKPLLATLTPMSGSRAIFKSSIDRLNERIRSLASEEGASLVDLAREFSGSEDERFPDGIHPDASGASIIAMAFSEKL